MHSPSASPVPGPDGDPGFLPLESLAADPVEWQAWLASDLDESEPPGDDDEEYLDPESSVLPPDEDLAVIEAEVARFAAERFADAQYLARADTAELAGAVAADQARKRGPRGPGLPGSADLVPGGSSGPAGGFGAGECLDTAPGSAVLLGFIETAVDSGRRVRRWRMSSSG